MLILAKSMIDEVLSSLVGAVACQVSGLMAVVALVLASISPLRTLPREVPILPTVVALVLTSLVPLVRLPAVTGDVS